MTLIDGNSVPTATSAPDLSERARQVGASLQPGVAERDRTGIISDWVGSNGAATKVDRGFVINARTTLPTAHR